jgi:F-type H+-transporting ATPase subunit alpha
MVELLKQPQYQPLSVAEQVVSLYAGTKGHLDDVEIKTVQQWEKDFLQYINDKHAALLDSLMEQGDLTDDVVNTLETAIKEFKAGYTPTA